MVYWFEVSSRCCFLSTFLSVQPSATEKVDWFPECTTEIPDSDELREWLILGQVNIKIIHWDIQCLLGL